MLSGDGCRHCLLFHLPALIFQAHTSQKLSLYVIHIPLQAAQDFLGHPATISAKILAELLGGLLHLGPDLRRIVRQVIPVVLVDSDNCPNTQETPQMGFDLLCVSTVFPFDCQEPRSIHEGKLHV